MKIKYINQGPRDMKCGQAVLAMITGTSIDEICKIIGTEGGTFNTDIYKVLKKHNIPYLYKRCKYFDKIPNNSIVKIGYKTFKDTHFIFKTNNKFYDPYTGIIEKYSDNIESISYINLVNLR
jgi:hypothetical protein